MNELVDVLSNPPKDLEENFIYTEEEGFVHEAMYLEEEPLEELFEESNRLPNYVPSKEELLNYVDQYYFEKNDAYYRLYEHLNEQYFDGNSGEAEEIATEIHDFLSIDFTNLSGVIDYLIHLGLPIKEEVRFEKLLELVGELSMNIRLWTYNGYTPIEFRNVMRERPKVKNVNLLEKYIIALTNLYGRVTPEKVTEIYNLQNKGQVTVKEVEALLGDPSEIFEEHLVFVKWDEFVAEDLVLFEEEYYELVEAQKGKPYYIPEQEELFLYVDPHFTYYPKEFKKLVDYLSKNLYENNKQRAETKADDIHLALEMGDGSRGALYEIEKDGYLFESQKQFSELTDYIVRLSNNTRMRENNGFTPKELSKIEQEKRDEIKKRPGRNDPCHCGSGKKYKKCCLKKDRLKELNIN